MLQKSMLVELIKEVLTENPELLSVKAGVERHDKREPAVSSTSLQNGGQKVGQFRALEQLARLANQQGKEDVANYLYLAIEADTLPPGVLDKIKLAKEPYVMVEKEYDLLAQQLETTWQAPYHAKLVQDLKKRFLGKHCLKRSYDY
ncbi:MAG: hypothetical protein KGZ96_10460 [Clostridia bacterium]|nr:hypothetical protein [Clostridia bacterium]